MIIYLADRSMNILAACTNNLPKGLKFINDKKTEDIESGVATFTVDICYDETDVQKAKEYCQSGNYILVCDDKGENGFYTIIETSNDRKDRSINLYAEDGGLDLLNEVVDVYEATETQPIKFYIQKFAYDSGFEIGINEVSNLSRKLSWTSQETCTSRILSIANSFDAEIGFSFAVEGLAITHKYINIYKKRGNENVTNLRLNTDIDNITVKTSIADLATCLIPTGGTPEGAQSPINLAGYKYDDGDFYINEIGWLASRKALSKWSRYQWEKHGTYYGGHIVKYYTYDTTSQAVLCSRALSNLKKYCDVITNYEVDISILPDDIRIGDTVNIIDENGELYVNARVLKLESSSCDQSATATLGDFLIREGGISEKVQMMAEQFSSYVIKQRESTYKTQQLAKSAKETADDAVTKATEASDKATEAKQDANNAITKATDAMNKATDAINESSSALKTANDAKDTAADSLTKINSATVDLEKAKQNITNLQNDISSTTKTLNQLATEAGQTKETLDGLSGDLQETKENLEISYAKKTDLSDTEASLKAEITKSATELSTNIEKTYAGKTELTEIQVKLQSQITQNASGLSSQATQISKLQNDTTDVQAKITAASQVAADAQAKAQAAQTSADIAKSAADDAQTAADTAAASAKSAQDKADEAQTMASNAATRLTSAEKDLSDAKANLTKVTSDVNSTKEQVQAAQDAVTAAQIKVDQAAKDASEAQTAAKNATTIANTAKSAASEAQQTADNAKTVADEASKTAQTAKDTADKAQETVAALTKRVTLAETNISQNSEAIGLNATKVEEIGDKLKNDYYSKTETDAAIKVQADKIESTVTKVEDINGVVQKTSSIANQLSDKFSWLVKSGTSATDFTLTDRTATLISNYINLNGLVSFGGLNSEAQSKINNAVSDASNAKSTADSALSKVDSVDTLLSSWCSANDQTLINGAKIYTGSITAEKLSVTTLSSLTANLGSITAGSINIGGKFIVDTSGNLKATSAELTGKITATSGTIAGINIESGRLYTSKEGIVHHQTGDPVSSTDSNRCYVLNTTELYDTGYLKVKSDYTVHSQTAEDGADLSGTVGTSIIRGGYLTIKHTVNNGGYTSIKGHTITASSNNYGTTSISGGSISSQTIKTGSGWFGKQYFSGGEWIGFYNSQGGTRKGWIGHDGGNNLNIRNEAGGVISITSTLSAKAIEAVSMTNSASSGTYSYYWATYDNGNGRLKFNIYNGTSWGSEIHMIRHSNNSMTSLRPGSDGGCYLGTSNCRWATVYSTSGSVSTSDLKQKDVIEDYDFKARDFIMGLKPIAYKLKSPGAGGKRIHMGFGAQPVDKLIKDLNMGDLSIVEAWKIDESTDIEEAYHGEEIDDEHLSWGMKYEELFAPLIALVQEQQIKIEKLEKLIGGN